MNNLSLTFWLGGFKRAIEMVAGLLFQEKLESTPNKDK
jgi:hypothetical protein